MTQEDLIKLLKVDLQLTTTAFDGYLAQLLAAAEGMIAREGVDLTDSAEDNQLRIMYADYLYRKRAGDNPQMPRMLRWALNNRLFGQKAGAQDVT